MGETFFIILLHQLVFQGMFLIKNLSLSRKIRGPVRGNNPEANIAILFFVLYIGLSIGISYADHGFGEILVINRTLAMISGMVLLLLNLIVSGLSLIDLSDSWRVGVIEDENTELVTGGIYRITRNPYFVSYLIMFAGYTVLLQNVLLLTLSVAGFLLIHKMIIREEQYLRARHGESYVVYTKRVPRYLFV